MNTGKTVWVVDDNHDCRQLYAEFIGAELAIEHPKEFASATELLAALKIQPAPDVILMDIQMPKISGIEAIPLVHQLAPNTKVVIFTSFFDPEKQRQALANGAAGFVRKDRRPIQIIEAITAALSQPISATAKQASQSDHPNAIPARSQKPGA